MNEKKSLTIKIGDQALSILTMLSKATNQPVEKVLVCAIGLYTWAIQESSNGSRIGSVTKTEDNEDIVQFIDLGSINKQEVKEQISDNITLN